MLGSELERRRAAVARERPVARQFGGRRLQARVNQLGAQVLAGGIRSGFSPAKVQAFAGVEPGTPPLRLVRKEPAR